MKAPVGLAECRAHLELLMGAYADAAGVGGDDYDPQPRWHAMAEAKHLSALAAMRRGRLLGDAALVPAVNAAVDRLTAGRADTSALGTAWGLGFAYGSAPADEPYTITTAQTVVALLQLAPLLTAGTRDAVAALCRDGLCWLDQHCPKVVVDGAEVPVYSPSNPRQVDNATAYWAHALALAEQSALEVRSAPLDAARLLLARAVPGVGWRYDDHSPRADLLHTCYIALALMAVIPPDDPVFAAVDEINLSACTQFLAAAALRDHFDLIPLAAATDEARPWNKQGLRAHGEWALTGFATAARPWAVGELLVVAAAGSTRPAVGGLWRNQLRWLSSHAVTEFAAPTSFRHSMHVAHGLARALEVLRA